MFFIKLIHKTGKMCRYVRGYKIIKVFCNAYNELKNNDTITVTALVEEDGGALTYYEDIKFTKQLEKFVNNELEEDYYLKS